MNDVYAEKNERYDSLTARSSSLRLNNMSRVTGNRPVRVGAPSKIHTHGSKIVDQIRAGLIPKYACMAVGISWLTMHRWMLYGEQEINEQFQELNPTVYHDGIIRDPAYGEFYVAVHRAIAERQAEALKNILDAGKDPERWQANAWFLERTDPENFGRRDRLTVVPGTPLDDPAEITPELQEQIANAMLEQVKMRSRALLPAGSSGEETN